MMRHAVLVIRIGSRESLLAVRQAEIIRRPDPVRQIRKSKAEIVTMKTTGDKILDKSLAKIGGKGTLCKRTGPGPSGRKD